MAKRLYKSRKNRIIAGVAGGIAEYFDIDPVIVRIFFVVSTLAWGVSLIAYIIMWIIVPDERRLWEDKFMRGEQDADYNPYEDEEIEEVVKKKTSRKPIAGIILIVLGSLIFIDNVFIWLDFGVLFSITLIGVGAYLLLRYHGPVKNAG